MSKSKLSSKEIEVFVKREGLAKRIRHITFSLKYALEHKEFGKKAVKALGNRESSNFYSALIEKMSELSKIDMQEAKRIGKVRGCEPIPFKRFDGRLQEAMSGIEIIGKDSTLSVFRFDQNNRRMICKTDREHPNLLYVIAFDLKFNAYDHG